MILVSEDTAIQFEHLKVAKMNAWIKKLPVGDDYEVGNQFLEMSRQDREIIQDLVKLGTGNASL